MSRALAVVALSLLLVTSMLGPAFVSPTSAQSQTVSISDGPEYGGFWQESDIQDNAVRSDLSSPIELDLKQGSDQINDFTNTDFENDFTSQSGRVYATKTAFRGNSGLVTSLPDETNKYLGLTRHDGQIHIISPDYIKKWNGSSWSEVVTLGSNNKPFIGEGIGESHDVWTLSDGGTFGTQYEVRAQDLAGGGSSTKTVNVPGKQIRGFDAFESDVYVGRTIVNDASGVSNLEDQQLLRIAKDGDHFPGPVIPGNEPHGISKPDGLEYDYRAITYFAGEEIRIVEGSSTKATFNADEPLTGAWVDPDTHELYYLRHNSQKLMKMQLFDQWSNEAIAKYTKSYPQQNVEIKNVNWEGQAPQDLNNNGLTRLRLDYNTIDSVGSGSGTFSETIGSSYSISDGDVEWRINAQDYGRADWSGSSTNPEVNELSWDYEYYESPGTIISDPLSVGDAESFNSLEIAGSGGSDVNVEILDSDGNVVSSQSGVSPGSTVDISDAPVDASTQEVQVRLTMQSDGGDSPTISGWSLDYESVDPVDITGNSATIAGQSTTDFSGTTEVGYEDTFTVESTSQNATQVKWYVSGVEAQNQSVSGTGPFSFSTEWQPGQVGEQQVTAEVIGENGGVDSASWTFQVENINAPEITGWNATVGGQTTEEVQLDTGIGSSDRFALTDVSVPDNQEVQAVEWFVDQEKVLTQNAPPYEFTREWGESDSGQVDVTAEVVGLENARSQKQWTLQVRDIGIIGESSGAASQGEVIEVRQTFRTFTGDSEKIDVEVSYNEDVLRLISDNSSLSSTVTSGESRTWEFQLTDSDYEGDPITISATQSDRTATKTFSITQRSAGGFLPGGGGDSPLSLVLGNTWLGFLGLGSTLTYILQGVAGAGLFGLVWAQDTGRVSVPVVGRELDRLDFWIKAIGGYALGALVAGVTIPWVALTTAALGGVYYWRTR